MTTPADNMVTCPWCKQSVPYFRNPTTLIRHNLPTWTEREPGVFVSTKCPGGGATIHSPKETP